MALAFALTAESRDATRIAATYYCRTGRRNGNCNRRACRSRERSRPGADVLHGAVTTTPSRNDRRALSVLQRGDGRGHGWRILEALCGKRFGPGQPGRCEGGRA